jgi:hypothetical protein
MKNKFVLLAYIFSCTAIFSCSNKHSNANDELTNAAIRQTMDSAKAIIQQAKDSSGLQYIFLIQFVVYAGQ